MNNFWAASLCFLALSGCQGAGDPPPLARTSSTLIAQGPSPAASVTQCEVVESGIALPDEVRETSGLALSRLQEGVLWTHNDAGGGARVMAIDSQGELISTVAVRQADAEDWEDVESGPCDEGACLYIADIGDNDAEREHVTVYRFPEPAAGVRRSEPATALNMRYPDGPQDAEALIVLDSGDLYIVTKGQDEPIALYRYPGPANSAETVTLERVGELLPEPEDADDRVTAATVSADGRWVAIRSRRELFLYPLSVLSSPGTVEPTIIDLRPVNQRQGESVALAADGTLWLSSEADGKDEGPSLARLQCTFTGDPTD